jgi:hypothetical protein
MKVTTKANTLAGPIKNNLKKVLNHPRKAFMVKQKNQLEEPSERVAGLPS